MGDIITYNNYGHFKEAFDAEIKMQANSFVKVGYLLKVARDTNILYESGYGTVAEFAWNEYHLKKDAVSRYIAINDKFSVNGTPNGFRTNIPNTDWPSWEKCLLSRRRSSR